MAGIARKAIVKEMASESNTSNISQIATVGQATVWMSDGAGNLKCFNLETGREISSAPALDVNFFVRNALDNKVVLVTAGGLVGMYAPAEIEKQNP